MKSVLRIRSSWPVLAFALLCGTGCAAFPGGKTAQQPPQATSQEDAATTALALAELSQIRGDLEEAAEHCQVAIGANPQMAEAYHRLAILQAKQDQFEQSFASFTRALRLSPHDPKLLSDLGYALYLDDRFEMSAKALRKAIQLDPTLNSAKNHLAMVLEQGNLQEESVAPQQLADSKNDKASLSETNGAQLATIDDSEVVTDMPRLEADEIVSDANVLVESSQQTSPQVVLPRIAQEQSDVVDEVDQSIAHLPEMSPVDSSAVQPVQYLQERSSDSSSDESDSSHAVDPAIFYDSVEEATPESSSNSAAKVQPATHREPVARRRGNPMSDLSEAMKLLEVRRVGGLSQTSEQTTAEIARESEPNDAPHLIRLDPAPRSSGQDDRSSLNIID